MRRHLSRRSCAFALQPGVAKRHLAKDTVPFKRPTSKSKEREMKGDEDAWFVCFARVKAPCTLVSSVARQRALEPNKYGPPCRADELPLAVSFNTNPKAVSTLGNSRRNCVRKEVILRSIHSGLVGLSTKVIFSHAGFYWEDTS